MTNQSEILNRLAALDGAGRLAMLASGATGLTSDEAARRLVAAGPNEPAPAARGHPLAQFLENFTHTLALLLWFAAGLSFASGIPELGGAIVAVVAVNGLFAFVQERRAEHVVEGLMERVAVQASVVREGVARRLPAAGLVPGDLVHLGAGDIVPADCVLLDADNLSLDLSVVTGESIPVERNAAVQVVTADTPAFDVPCFAPAGAAVITGRAEGGVFATGASSTIGQIATLVEGVERGESMLERQIGELSRVTVVVAALAGMATLSLSALSTETGFLAALTFGTGVIVALVPEGLLPTLSVSLAVGASRMAARGAAVRRLSAVEIIGSATVICTDKTGTLTENAVTVGGFEAIDGPEEALMLAVRVAALCNNAVYENNAYAGDGVDVALANWAATHGADPVVLRERYRRIEDVPFDAVRRYMAVTVDDGSGPRVLVKGGPEAVAALAGFAEVPAGLAAVLERAAGEGERLLMLAEGEAGGTPRLLGLVRLQDPPRPEVPAAIAACRRAGVRVVMLTGDHPSTARSVAQTIGLADEQLVVIEGAELAQMPDSAVPGLLRGNAVVARATPEQKLRIVTLLRGAGEIVVVTGDGINDAPALRAADVGVAMGRRGTEVAKQASDIVLSDDNFATIVAAIEEGRSIKQNIRRFVSYVFTSNVAELAPFVVYVFLPVPLPLAVIQVLAIDLGTDLLPALALGTERPAAGVMVTPPEPPRRPLLTRALGLRTFLFFGVIEAVLGLTGFFAVYLAAGWRPFESLAAFADSYETAATGTFLGIVGGQVGCLFAERDGPLRQRLSFRSNRWLVWGLVFEFGLALALVYLPGVNGLFAMTSVGPLWLLLVPAGAAVFLGIDLVRRRFDQLRGASPF